MNKFEEIIKKYEEEHGVKIGCYDTAFYYDGRSFLDLHVIGEDLRTWHRVDLNGNNYHSGLTTKDDYYIAGRAIADELVKKLLAEYDLSSINDIEEFEDILSDKYAEDIEDITKNETEAAARARVINNRDHIEHAISESCMDPADMLEYMTAEDGFRSLDHLGLYDYNVTVCEHAVMEAREAIEAAINNAHFTYTI
jgi:hypothetical protein